MIREFFQAQDTKAIPYRTELTDAGGPLLYGDGPAAYNTYNGFNTDASARLQTPLSQRNARAHMETYGGREAIDWLAIAANFTATSAASAEYRFDRDGKALELQKAPSDPSDTELAPPAAIQLFAEPNPFMDWSDLCELSVLDLLLVGNTYWVRWGANAPTNGQPSALYRMAPQYVRIKPGPFGVAKYLYRLPGTTQDSEFTPDQVIHIKRPNPLDPYYGVGAVQLGARSLDMELELTKTAASYYQKQALPSGVVQTERRVPRDVFNKLKSQIRAFYSRSGNAGELMVLEAGLQYKAISPNANDAGFQTMGAWSRDRTFAMFNLNKSLVGMWDQGDDPQIGQWQTLFDQKTMIPLTKRLGRVISRALTQPIWGIDFVIDYTETQQPDDLLNRAGTLAKLPGVKVHEVRDAAGLPASTGDKEIDNMVLNQPGQNMDANGAGGSADPNLPGESGRPPLPENTTQFKRRTGNNRAPAATAGGSSARTTRSGKALPPGVLGIAYADAEATTVEESLVSLDQHLAEIKALPPATHTHVGDLQGDHVTPPEDILFAKRRSAVSGSVSGLSGDLAAACRTLERGLLDSLDGKADQTAYQRVKASKAWKVFQDRLEAILQGGAQDAMSMANMHHASQGLDPAELDYESEAKAIIQRDGGIAGLMKTIKKRVLDAVLTGQRRGDAQTELAAALQDATGGWQDNAAPQIALDVATAAYNHGTLEVADANGSPTVIVSDGEDFDEPCIEANGQVWPLAKARANLQQHSRCQRAFVPVVG